MADWQGNPLDAGSDGTVIALGDPARLEDVLEAMGGSANRPCADRPAAINRKIRQATLGGAQIEAPAASLRSGGQQARINAIAPELARKFFVRTGSQPAVHLGTGNKSGCQFVLPGGKTSPASSNSENDDAADRYELRILLIRVPNLVIGAFQTKQRGIDREENAQDDINWSRGPRSPSGKKQRQQQDRGAGKQGVATSGVRVCPLTRASHSGAHPASFPQIVRDPSGHDNLSERTIDDDRQAQHPPRMIPPFAPRREPHPPAGRYFSFSFGR